MSIGSYREDQALNELSDADVLWGPLLFLRPEQHKLLTAPRMLTICTLFGGFYGMCANLGLGLLLRQRAHAVLPVYAMPAMLIAIGFACGQLMFARAWNRRARQLARRADWEERNGRSAQKPSEPAPHGF